MTRSGSGALRLLITSAGLASVLLAQPAKQVPPAGTKQVAPRPAPPKPVQAQSSSTISSTTAADGTQTVDIRNVSYEVTSTNVPGRPPDERLLLRRTTHSKETLGDIGIDATVTLEAWRFGDDPRNKPLYTLTTSGTGGDTLDAALFIASRGLEEQEWWSIYRLGTGQHLLDTYVPLVDFSISREVLTLRYAGLDVPPDDTPSGNASDARLKQPNVIAVLSYASEDHVIREALLTSDDRQQAALLRSFADVTRTLEMQEGPPIATAGKGKAPEPSRTLKLTFSQNYPSPANTLNVLIPVVGDDLDLTRAQLPARMHVAAWKR
jgi:hypothetical protein